MGPAPEPTPRDLRRQALSRHRAGRLDEARALYARYLAQVPDDGTMWSNAGALLRSMGQHGLALQAQRRAARLQPGSTAIRNNLANILADLGRNEAAIEIRRALLAEKPGDPQIIAMIGKSLRSMGRPQVAARWLARARSRHPDHAEIAIQLALSQLAAGDYAAGFVSFRARWQTGELTPRDMPRPEWRGEPLAGRRILVMPEQGFGDCLAFARFLPVLRRYGPGQVLFHCAPAVAPLCDGIAGADRTGTAMPDPGQYDIWVNLIDLAALHFGAEPDREASGASGTGPENAVPPPARLVVPPDSVAAAEALLRPHSGPGAKLRVGVVWSGSTTYRDNGFRSFSHREFHRLLDIDGVQLFSLYKGPQLGEFHRDGSSIAIVDLASGDRHFGDCAALMQQMDLIVTSDTATAHLAGSLGRPVWTLLHWDPFWMWRHEGTTTPWYPTMRLFRQDVPGDWAGVFDRVHRGVSRIAAEREREAAR